jgi:hypothetical protein
MFGIESLSGTLQAVVLVGVVLAEAAVLYFGYGALERAVGSYVVDLIRGE